MRPVIQDVSPDGHAPQLRPPLAGVSIEPLHRTQLDRFERIARIASRLFNVSMAWVVDEAEDELYRFFDTDGAPARDDPAGWPAVPPTSTADMEILGSSSAGGSTIPAALAQTGLGFVACKALTDDAGRRLGTLVLADQNPRQLDEADLETLSAFARTVMTELSMTQQSSTDPLTGLLNRLGFSHAAEAVVGLCRQGQIRTSLLLFDLDGFKQINDRHGHSEGDRALVSFARMLKASFRATDLKARLGGDEFAVLANSTGTHRVTPPLERLQRAVDQYNAAVELDYQLAFSVGCVEVDPARPRDLDTMVAQADLSMYAHKRQRRERRSN